MARRKKTCERKQIRFKTRRGRFVSFFGRSGGSTRHGGKCSPKAATAAQKKARSRFAKVARTCRMKTRKARASCVKSRLKQLNATGHFR